MFLMSEVPLCKIMFPLTILLRAGSTWYHSGGCESMHIRALKGRVAAPDPSRRVQGYLAHKKPPPPLGQP